MFQHVVMRCRINAAFMLSLISSQEPAVVSRYLHTIPGQSGAGLGSLACGCNPSHVTHNFGCVRQSAYALGLLELRRFADASKYRTKQCCAQCWSCLMMHDVKMRALKYAISLSTVGPKHSYQTTYYFSVCQTCHSICKATLRSPSLTRTSTKCQLECQLAYQTMHTKSGTRIIRIYN